MQTIWKNGIFLVGNNKYSKTYQFTDINYGNWRKGKRTHVIVDEFHVVFENEHSAEFFSSAWRRFRKRNAYPTAITQNVEYLLDSVEASTMLSNSEKSWWYPARKTLSHLPAMR